MNAIHQQYSNFKPQDIAAMCVDIKISLEDENYTFSEKRSFRNMVVSNPAYRNRVSHIANLINELGAELKNTI